MGLLESGESDGQSRKRVRDEELTILDDLPCEGWASVSKRPCSVESVQEEEQQLRLLEDLCGLDSPPQEGNILESGTQEDLVTEMMRSLERVISATEETLLHEPSISGSSQSLCWNLSGKTQSNLEGSDFTDPSCALHSSRAASDITPVPRKEGGENCSESKLDFKFLLEASDDELGIPQSPKSEVEALNDLSQDESWLDGSFPELIDDVNMVPTSEVVEGMRPSYGRNGNGWLSIADGYIEAEEPILSERDYCNLVYSDYHF